MSPSLRRSLSIAAGIALAISFVYTPASMPKLGLCLFRRMTDLPCPGCGLTRSFCAISHGDFPAAWGFHPFGFAFYALAVTLLFWPLVGSTRPELERRILGSRITGIVCVTFLVAMFVFGGARIWKLVHPA